MQSVHNKVHVGDWKLLHRKITIITAEEMEEVESVRALKEDKISFARDSGEDESSSVGTKTDGELVENSVTLQATRKIPGVMSVHFTIVMQLFPVCVAATVKYMLNVETTVSI